MQKNVFLSVSAQARKPREFPARVERGIIEQLGKKDPGLVAHILDLNEKKLAPAQIREIVSSKKPDHVFMVVFTDICDGAKFANVTHHHGDKLLAMKLAQKLSKDLGIRGQPDLFPVASEAHTLSTLKKELLQLAKMFDKRISQAEAASTLDNMFSRYKEHFSSNSQRLPELVKDGLQIRLSPSQEYLDAAAHLARSFELYSALFAHGEGDKIIPGHHVLLPLLPEYERNAAQVINALVKAIRYDVSFSK